MGEFRYIGYEALQARAMKALTLATEKAQHDLVAMAKPLTGYDTGAERSGIHAEPLAVSGMSVIGRVSSSEYYDVWQHEGTGPHIIRAQPGHFLAWPGAGHPVREVHHPGTPATHFLSRPLIQLRPIFEAALRAAASQEF